jgi:Sulfotransferase family
MIPVTVFILSDVRSGSTLLDQCLGAHPKVVSLGEVHWLAAYVTDDRTLYDPDHPLVCSCRARVSDCPFWTSVAARLGRPLESLQLRSGVKPAKKRPLQRPQSNRAVQRLLRAVPHLSRFRAVRSQIGADALARDLRDLYEAVAAVTGCAICVDSSKSAFRFRALHDLNPARSLAIVLTRDYRAVVHSKMKRGLTLEAAALGWKRKMREIDALTRDLPWTTVHRISYESLCENPNRELREICEFLKIEFSEEMLTRPRAEVHHIGGSPSKFDESRSRIVLDRSHVDRFDAADRSCLRKIVGKTATKWGY